MREQQHLEPEWWNRRGVSRPQNTDVQRGAAPGVARTTAYALAVLGLEVVHRSTVRALLPRGRTKLEGPAQQRVSIERYGRLATTNVTSDRYGAALRNFEDRGWIKRGTEFVLVLDAEALRAYGVHDADALPERLLQVEAAVEQVKRQIREAENPSRNWVEQRRRELLAIMALMQAPVTGTNRSGSGSVRFVPRGKVI